MTKIKEVLQDSATVTAIYHSYEQQPQHHRPHLGASIIGEKCPRKLWYTFHWCLRPAFPGRILRLFKTGHLAEPRFTQELRSIGVEVSERDPVTARQYDFKAPDNPHFGGSMDGAGKGFPEAPETWHVIEYKTHSENSFNKLKKNGVKAAKYTHYAQMQCYMHWTGMQRAFYLAVNKNTDELYGERIRYDKDEAQALMAKAKDIIKAAEPPAKISEKENSFECRYCDYKTLCHGETVVLPDVNCRTCCHSQPVAEGWQCARLDEILSHKKQAQGCAEHLYIPILLAVALDVADASADSNTITYQIRGSGEQIINGNRDDNPGQHNVYSSHEFRGAMSNLEALAFSDLMELRSRFAATVTAATRERAP